MTGAVTRLATSCGHPEIGLPRNSKVLAAGSRLTMSSISSKEDRKGLIVVVCMTRRTTRTHAPEWLARRDLHCEIARMWKTGVATRLQRWCPQQVTGRVAHLQPPTRGMPRRHAAPIRQRDGLVQQRQPTGEGDSARCSPRGIDLHHHRSALLPPPRHESLQLQKSVRRVCGAPWPPRLTNGGGGSATCFQADSQRCNTRELRGNGRMLSGARRGATHCSMAATAPRQG